jgi:MscS family membrane protein
MIASGVFAGWAHSRPPHNITALSLLIVSCRMCPVRLAKFDRIRSKRRATLLLLIAAFPASSLRGQTLLKKVTTTQAATPQAGQAQPAPEPPKDPLGRDTPFGTVVGFLKMAEKGDWQGAAEFLDSRQPPVEKQDLARELKLVMDKGLTLDLGTLSKNPEGTPNEAVRRTRNEIGTAHIDSQSLVIFVDRIQPTAKRPPYWLFSAETLVRIPDIAQNLEVPWFEAYIPKWLVENRVFGIPVFRWILIPLVIGVAFGVVLVITWLLGLLVRGIFRLARTNPLVLRAGFLGPLRVLILAYLIHAAAPLAHTLVGRQIWGDVIAPTAAIVGFAWLVMRSLDLIAELAVRRFRKIGLLRRIAHVRLSRWVVKGFVAVVALVAILYKVGINPGTVVAGVGIGGIALAFAAQKTIENVFGTVMIVADQPLRVGDFCKIGESLGTIEDIGLRSTRVRTPDNTLLTVPNGQLASTIVENFAYRETIRFRHVIGLRYETTSDQLLQVLAGIRTLLQEHPKVDSSSARVRFISFGAFSLDLEIFAYLLLSDFAVFLEVQEEMLLRIMQIIESAGTGIAIPSQTTYLARGLARNARKRQAGTQEVHDVTKHVPTG